MTDRTIKENTTQDYRNRNRLNYQLWFHVIAHNSSASKPSTVF